MATMRNSTTAPAPDAQPEAPCTWCGGDTCKSVMQPAFCIDCVTAMLRGEDTARRDMFRPAPAPLPGYQYFTVKISDEDAALLLAEMREQEAFHRVWSEKNGFPVRSYTPDMMASAIVNIALRERAQARTEGGAQ